MRDSYERFFSEGYISKDQFFEFGLNEIIYSPIENAEREWESLKRRIHSNGDVCIRGFGRGGNGTHLFFDLYKNVLNNSKVKKDSTNNAEPTKVIRELTGYSKTKNLKHEPIRNYQVSHMFGRTKNVYAFAAPWNIVYMPKMLDPFTGHEAKGKMVDEYRVLFQKQGYDHFERLIDDFNELMCESLFVERVSGYLDKITANKTYEIKDIEKLKKAVKEEFSPIDIEA